MWSSLSLSLCRCPYAVALLCCCLCSLLCRCLITASPAQTATGKVAQCQTQTHTQTHTDSHTYRDTDASKWFKCLHTQHINTRPSLSLSLLSMQLKCRHKSSLPQKGIATALSLFRHTARSLLLCPLSLPWLRCRLSVCVCVCGLLSVQQTHWNKIPKFYAWPWKVFLACLVVVVAVIAGLRWWLFV